MLLEEGDDADNTNHNAIVHFNSHTCMQKHLFSFLFVTSTIL